MFFRFLARSAILFCGFSFATLTIVSPSIE